MQWTPFEEGSSLLPCAIVGVWKFLWLVAFQNVSVFKEEFLLLGLMNLIYPVPWG